MGKPFNRKKKRVFLSYATEDKAISSKIAEQLEESGVDVWFAERELLPGDSMVDKIGKAISSSDYVFLLLSKNFLKYELAKISSKYLDELTTRDVAIIPVLIDDCEVPDFLSKFQMIDLRRQTNRNIRKLIKQIVNAPRIDFSSLTEHEFMNLVTDLLKRVDFEKIQIQHGVADRGIDLTAEYRQRDPFGMEKKEIWIVETKFYQRERASLKALRALMGSLVAFPGAKALLITNGLLTSYAKKWLRDVQSIERRYIRVIEGPELRNLLLRFPELVDQYFPSIDQRGINAS